MSNHHKYDPLLDLPAPEGKDAEWALLRLAQHTGIPAIEGTWQELADKIYEKLTAK